MVKKRTEAVVGYHPPRGTSIGEVIDELGRRYQRRVKAEAVAASLKKDEDLVRDYLLGLTHELDLDGARGKRSGGSIAVVSTDVPQLEDWQAFFKFAKRRGNDDLLQASVSVPAWRERLRAKIAVPGVRAWKKTVLRYNPARKK